jgi:hypothetical protein
MTATTRNRIWIATMGLVILGGGIYGFGHKFLALVRLSLDQQEGADAAFAVAPVVNYLLASFGFLCLVGWAAAHGMFHDIEAPKHTMLETEERLDGLAHDEKYSQSILE